MFVEAVVFAIIIGYLLKGKLKNIEIEKIKGIAIVLCAFLIKLILVVCIQKGFLKFGMIAYIAYILQYSLIIIFVFLNKENPFLIIMGIGILLNAAVIFTNGGLMPVNTYGLKINVGSRGMYTTVNNGTRLGALADIIPGRLIIKFVCSIGDIITAIGMMLYIIIGMKKKRFS